jgi:hypothetical protein
MMPARVHRRPDPALFEGKTYSLRPDAAQSDDYYETVARLTDILLQSHPDPQTLLSKVQTLSRRKRALKSLLKGTGDSPDSLLVRILHDHLHTFTPHVGSHLQSLRGFDRLSRTLRMSEEQYHLAMVEIELVNRLYVGQFRTCDKKFALLPHCLRDLKADCRSVQRGVDYVCKGCSDECSVNHVTKALRRHKVEPFIWMTANLNTLFRGVKKEGKSLGVFGIACVPELMRGMRTCLKHGIPAIGIPLDANRCARWWGEFHLNTVNVRMVEHLLDN